MAYGRQMTLLADPLDVDFATHHAQHPEIYDELLRLARRWKAAGHTRCSINMLFEIVRYESGLAHSDGDGPALNNSLRSRYARLLMWNEPDLVGLFETRSLRSSVEAS